MKSIAAIESKVRQLEGDIENWEALVEESEAVVQERWLRDKDMDKSYETARDLAAFIGIKRKEINSFKTKIKKAKKALQSELEALNKMKVYG